MYTYRDGGHHDAVDPGTVLLKITTMLMMVVVIMTMTLNIITITMVLISAIIIIIIVVMIIIIRATRMRPAPPRAPPRNAKLNPGPSSPLVTVSFASWGWWGGARFEGFAPGAGCPLGLPLAILGGVGGARASRDSFLGRAALSDCRWPFWQPGFRCAGATRRIMSMVVIKNNKGVRCVVGRSRSRPWSPSPVAVGARAGADRGRSRRARRRSPGNQT